MIFASREMTFAVAVVWKERIRQAAFFILLTALICAVWFSMAGSSVIRFDSERMIFDRDTALAQYRQEGRPGLALLMDLFSPAVWNPGLNGCLFLLFFAASAWLLYYWLVRFTENRWRRWWYGLFVLLYGTSPVWAFQVYFTLQSPWVALGMALAVAAAGFDVLIHTEGGFSLPVRLLWTVLSVCLNGFLMSVYQSLIVFYLAAAAVFLFCRLLRGKELKAKALTLWLLRVVLSFVLYLALVFALRGSGNAYMLNVHVRWGQDSFLTCLWNILVEVFKTAVMVHSGHFSLYLPGLVLLVLLLREKLGSVQSVSQKRILLLCAAALALLPLAFSFLQGNRPVPRTQFALQVVAAFWPVCFAGETEGRHRAVSALCLAAVLLQVLLVVRLDYTDIKRGEKDLETAQKICEDLGDIPESGETIAVIGSLPFEDDSLLMEKTDVFGRSFLEWAVEQETEGIQSASTVRLLRAVSGKDLRYADPGLYDTAAALAENMPAYPEEGYILRAEQFVVIRLPDGGNP